jgi:transposase
MASIDKQSIREEFESVKAEFKRLSAKGNLPQEYHALFNAMFMLFGIVISIFMERTTKKNNRNSSIPSSQTEKDESSKGVSGSKSKGLEENTYQSRNTRTVTTVEILAVNNCEYCGEDLSGVSAKDHERRTKIDIVFEKNVTHVDAEIKVCEKCENQTKASFPADMPGPLQYGSGIKAYMINLLIAQMISLNRVQKLVKALIGKTISEATILKYVLQLYAALEVWEQAAVEQLVASPVIHADETSLRVNKKNHWIHVYSSGATTIKILHEKRGIKAIEDINIIPGYSGIIIHDCWASYLSYEHCDHALCGSHILRELAFVIESNQYTWASDMKQLLQQTCKKVSKRKSKKLKNSEYEKLQDEYRDIISAGEEELPPIPEKRTKGKRGKIAKSDAHNLLERLKVHEESVLRFARNAHVSFTNNRAERDLRMSKVKQKVSGCFRTEELANAYCRISSYLQTMSYKGYNPLIAIQMALKS